MKKLWFVILGILISINLSAQSPHGDKLKLKCDVCHTSQTWVIKGENNRFDHTTTKFPLVGQHGTINCRNCHTNLIFSNTNSNCISCHKDIHEQTVGQECERCHTPNSWGVKNIGAIHQRSRFPLNGQHAKVDCYLCHKSSSLLRFDPMGTACLDCHAKEYLATSQPSHQLSKFPTDCFLCHNEKAWNPAKFDHNKSTAFPLAGGHIGITCISCHPSGYSGTSTACSSCHLANFNATINPAHIAAKFSLECKTCHTFNSWKPATFDHNTATNFPLTDSHVGLSCISCHAGGYARTATECVACHIKDYNSAANPSHLAAKFSTDCELCHNETNWKPSYFNHNTATTFPLADGHLKVACINCHTKGYAGTSPECSSCHITNYNSTTNPNHIIAKFSTDCKGCHTSSGWKPALFDHNINTTFPLNGAHSSVSCALCHVKGYAGTPFECVGCHLPNFNATTTPSHVTAKYPTNCKICHTTTAWRPSNFDHNTNTAFPLSGAHIGLACISCHSQGYAGIPNQCESCHLTNFNQTTNPGHVAGKFPIECKSCHMTSSWKPATFKHSSSPIPVGVECITCHLNDYNATSSPGHITSKFSTDCQICHTVSTWSPALFNHTTGTTFPLTGAHISLSCMKCHSKGYAGTSTDCSSCHLDNYNATTEPIHSVVKFPTSCETCHNSIAWIPSSFNHNIGTNFPLTGSHVGVACISCHATGYAGISANCVSCHIVNYNASVNPPHVAAKFSTDCKTCHSATGWSPALFNHNLATSFPLTGAHTAVSCSSCHSKGFVGIPMTCVSCHLTNYNASTNPSHSAAKFPTTCEVCHTTNGWTPSTFNHNTGTSFPLTGAHISVSCASCHTNGYAGIPATCISCHLINYNASTNPPHLTAKFSTDCKTCHTVIAWSPATFNHSTGTTFPLIGAHSGVSCISCHSKGYVGIATTCNSCHLANYISTTNPAHATAKFPTTCESCHTSTAWSPSTFNHNTSTTFPLTGAHIGVTCSSCHTNGYAGIATTCVSCHLVNYNASANPPHLAGKFSTDCKTCHSNIAWSPASFNHSTATTFPLTGAHIGVSCISCHATGYVGIATTCVSCHITNYNATTNPAHGAAKFPTTCETCHTSTSWLPSTFNHNTNTTFPLAGAHIGITCISCHANGYAGISTTCVSCHLSNFNATANPPHVSAKFSTDCKTCHTVNGWTPATFNHTTGTTFPLTGAHINLTCISCHSKGYVGIATTCVSCHLTNYNATTNPAHAAAKFPTTCETCHTSTTWSPSTFNHNTSTTFPLTGAHIGVTCISCHSKGYAGIATTCVSCHQADYNATTNPAHLAGKFSTDCKTCHTVTAWQPSTFNHTTATTFPLTGSHIGVACISCHSAGYAGIPTTCVSCHLTSYNSTTNPAHAAAKFPTTCESCHTVTVWTTSTFSHDTQYFKIYSGKHNGQWTLCSECHNNPTNYAVFTCLTCHNQASTNSSHQGQTGYVYNSTNCYSCHAKV